MRAGDGGAHEQKVTDGAKRHVQYLAAAKRMRDVEISRCIHAIKSRVYILAYLGTTGWGR